MLNYCLITGASAGIGRATSLELAKNGRSLILTGRREERLLELQKEILSQFDVDVQILKLDIQDRIMIEKVFKENPELLSKVDTLINNAGLALGVDSISEGNLDDWEQMIDTNIKGLLYMTRTLLPHLLEKDQADIINIGSISGRYTYPGGAVYCGTKHAVRAISEGMRQDLCGTNIRVCCIEPGMVNTEFSLVRLQDPEKAKSIYAGVDALTGHDIAECISWVLNRPKHVCIQEMMVFPNDQASISQVHRR